MLKHPRIFSNQKILSSLLSLLSKNQQLEMKPSVWFHSDHSSVEDERSGVLTAAAVEEYSEVDVTDMY
jgi:hypothetical protein